MLALEQRGLVRRLTIDGMVVDWELTAKGFRWRP